MSPAKILIVEDEAIIARCLRQMLVCLGHTVVGAVMSGEEAVAFAASLRPDLVLMDVGLSGRMDGVEAALQIREEQGIPVILLTGSTEAVRAASALAWVAKPFTERQLTAALEAARRKMREPSVPAGDAGK